MRNYPPGQERRDIKECANDSSILRSPNSLSNALCVPLSVSLRGAKAWIQRLTIQGRRTDNAIGLYLSMRLAEARAAAFERWKVTKAGGDPRCAESKPRAPTFAEAAEAVIAIHEANLT